jgi:hypothetical protein
MKFFTAKYLSLVLLACALTGSIEASRCAEGGCAQEERGCCFSSCYECGCNPLYCGAWDLQVQAGVDPIIWRNRGEWLALNCAATAPATVVTAIFDTPKFSTLFKTPWIVGGQVGYHMSDNTRVYVEFNYSQAQAKSTPALTLVGTTFASFVVAPSKYKLFDAYVGARYYWDRWCDRVAFFLGGKVGLTHRKSSTADLALSVTAPTVFPFTGVDFYRNSNVVSGGADFGLDFCFCGNWSFVITGSVIASCGPSFVQNIPTVAAGLAFTNLFPGGVRTELRFPVTAAVRYSF